MYMKSIDYDISTIAPAPRRSHLRAALLALPVGLVIAVATFASAHASTSHPRQSGANNTAGQLTAKTGTEAARSATDAVGRAAQNRNRHAVQHDLWGNPVYPGINFHASGTDIQLNPTGAGGR